jgi:hypothetical protein
MAPLFVYQKSKHDLKLGTALDLHVRGCVTLFYQPCTCARAKYSYWYPQLQKFYSP